MHCSECGEHVGSARFCPNCGAPVGKQVVFVHDRNSLHLLAYASGASRVFLIIGLTLALIGFGVFAFGALDFILQIFDSMESGTTAPPDFSRIMIALPAGFGLIFAGTILWNIGAVLLRRRS